MELDRGKVVETTSSTPSINWSECALCQEKCRETLVHPAKGSGDGYKYVAENLKEFQKLEVCPLAFDLGLLDEGDGFEETFRRNNACWHKSCRSKVSTTILNRKRKQQKSLSDSPVKTRKAAGTSSSSCEKLSGATEKTNSLCLPVPVCFFCDEPSGAAGLHEAWTLDLDDKVRCHARYLNDSSLLRKLADKDMVASESKYHLKCLTAFYRRSPKGWQQENDEADSSTLQSIAFAEVIAYIESFKDDEASSKVFSMPELCRLYANCLRNHDLPVADRVHSGRLREKILAAVPGLFSSHQGKGREVILMFNSDLRNIIKKAKTHDSEALELARAAEVVRKEIFNLKSNFNGRFDEQCQEKAIPASLKALVAFILDGPATSAMKQSESIDSSQRQAVLTISQLLAFNCRKFSKEEATFQRHNKERETPLPIYLSLKVHAETRKKELVDTLSSLGLGISYKRVMTISSQIAHSVIDQFEKDGVVVPAAMMKGVFTIGAVDNIDHNPSSTTASDSFHGTGISLIQNRETDEDGEEQQRVLFHPSQSNLSVPLLPEKYTTVLQEAAPSKEQFVPKSDGPHKPLIASDVNTFKEEYEWLETINACKMDSSEGKNMLPWSSYHASQRPYPGIPTSIIRLLPLLIENANSAALIKHVMDIVKVATEFLNAGQKPVLAMDQPLYALAKCIQWTWPKLYGEKEFLIMMGGFHIEQAALKTIGDWLAGSGWVSAITAAGVASSGVADSFLKSSHVTRTRHAHQVTAAALYILLRQGFEQYLENNLHPRQGFEEWVAYMKERQPQFLYWARVLEFELTILQFVRSVRTGDLKIYMQCLAQLLPWFFSLDHVNYARWLSVHVRDLTMLEINHPSIFQHFWAGGFVARKTKRPFSAIALDQAHEQCNALVKGDGGAVGLTNSPSALRRWMVAGPEISRMVEEFEMQTVNKKSVHTEHHEQLPSFEETFQVQVKEMVAVLEEMGNPFVEDSGRLFAIDSKDVMGKEVVNTVRTIMDVGEQQYRAFIEERFLRQEKTIAAPIHRNKLPLFSNQKARSIKQTTLGVLKCDMALFARLYIACQTRGGDLQQFFKHENQPWPPSIAKLGDLRTGNKADLAHCLTSTQNKHTLSSGETPKTSSQDASTSALDIDLVSAKMLDETTGFFLNEDCLEDLEDLLEEKVLVPLPSSVPEVDSKILDGAVIVQMLSPKLARTFQEYIELVFLPYILRQFESANRVDIVWDVYSPESLKASARGRRGCGSRKVVKPSTVLPSNWQSFLRDDENKTELFQLIASTLAERGFGEGKQFVTTHGTEVLCSPPLDASSIAPCSHEEADSRVILHAAHAVSSCHGRRVLIRTTDTDVLVLAVAHFHKMDALELWIAFGTGKQFRYIAAHDIARQLGQQRAWALLGFHAFTGCDTTSFFAGKKKKTAWNTWTLYPQSTAAFLAVVEGDISDETFATLERFVVLMYDHASPSVQVNDARLRLFSRNTKSLEIIPPTAAALKQHTLRAAYQANIWRKSQERDQQLPSPENWGWQRAKDQPWRPFWTTLSQAQDSCRELISCKCKSVCHPKKCSCKLAMLPCSGLCKGCGGDCPNE